MTKVRVNLRVRILAGDSHLNNVTTWSWDGEVRNPKYHRGKPDIKVIQSSRQRSENAVKLTIARTRIDLITRKECVHPAIMSRADHARLLIVSTVIVAITPEASATHVTMNYITSKRKIRGKRRERVRLKRNDGLNETDLGSKSFKLNPFVRKLKWTLSTAFCI